MSKAAELARTASASETALSNRNIIINGGFDVWQRGVSFSAQGIFYADRFRSDTNSNDNIVITKYDIPSAGETSLPIGFTSAIKFAWTAGSTGSLNDFRQRVEDPKRFMGQTVTLSYYIRASASCTVNNRRIGFSGVTNGPATSGLPNLSVTTTWQRVVDTVTLNTTTNAVFSASSFLDVVLSNPYRTTVDVYITGVQLEVGPVATPFEHRSYGQELALCQRYYYNYISGNLKSVFAATAILANYISGVITFPVTMRAAPSAVIASGSDYYREYSSGASGFSDFTGERLDVNSATLSKNGGGPSIAAGDSAIVYTNNASASISFDAEL